MYGVPPDLDLSRFTGAQLLQIALGEFQVQLKFERGLIIYVEGAWQLTGRNGEIVDAARPNSERSEYRLHVLLGHRVEAWSVHAPEWFELRFEGRFALRVYDDSDEFESFSIQPGDIFV